MKLEPVRNARAILIDEDATSGPLSRMRLQDQGYSVTLVRDVAGASTSARTTPAAVIFVQAEAGATETSKLIQALKTDDATRHLPIQLLNTTARMPAPRGLNSVARTNW
jgi:response regulator RpfG family c-di-GMP phosphodiesterase